MVAFNCNNEATGFEFNFLFIDCCSIKFRPILDDSGQGRVSVDGRTFHSIETCLKPYQLCNSLQITTRPQLQNSKYNKTFDKTNEVK